MTDKTETKPEKSAEKIVEKEAEIVTIHDFKSMLVGMDMVLGDNWTPSEEQWKRIRKKLDVLIETAERPATNTQVAYPQQNTPPVQINTGNETDILRSFPAIPSSVPEDAPIGQPGPSALAPPPRPQPLPANPGQRPPMAKHEGEQVKTPDIDSSAGYKSSFV